MEIIALRVRMGIVKNELQFQFAKAVNDTFEMVEETEDAIIIHTHDHADQDIGIDPALQLAPYYQVAFRLKDISPYQQQELKLYIDHTMYRNGRDRLLEYDDSNDIWYEQTYYKKEIKKKSSKWVACFTEENPGVDSITTAGVFRINIKDFSGNLIQTSKPVYVLPSEMTFVGYQRMLRDLIDINTDFVSRNSSTVGIGSTKSIEEIDLSYKIDVLNRTIKSLSNIMKLTSVAQKKDYSVQSVHKIRRFDAKVLRHVMKHGMQGKLPAISYVEDHDIYENRIVKYFSERILETMGTWGTNSPMPTREAFVNNNVYKSMFRIMGRDPSALIHDIVETRTLDKLVNQSSLKLYTFTFSMNTYNSFYKNCISVEEQQISTYGSGKHSNNPFHQNNNAYCGIGFFTKNNRMKLWLLKQLVNLYVPNQETKSIHIQSGKYDSITKDKPELASWFASKNWEKYNL